MIQCLSLKEIIPPIIPLEQQFEIVTSNKATRTGLPKWLKVLNKRNFALFWPICFFVVANLRTFWNTFTGLNNALLAQNWQISGRVPHSDYQGCIFRLTCSHPELTEDHVLTSAYVKIFRTVTRNAVNKSVWRKKDCFWLPLNKHAMNIWLSSLRIRAHLSWRTGYHNLCSPGLNKKKKCWPRKCLAAGHQ